VRTTPGVRTGIDVDRLQLGSAAGGAALPADPAGELPVADGSGTPSGQPTVTVAHAGETSFDVHVTGADAPFWLVLGQSLSAGWKATIGGASLGEAKLVDGYANGWQVNPAARTFDVHLEWTPQKRVWNALGISAVALLICLLLALLPGRRWRLRETMPVELRGLRESAEHRRRWGRLAVAIVLTGVIVALVVKPLAAPFAMIALLVAVATRRGRLVLRVGAPLCLALTALYVLEVQFRFHLTNSGQWVPAFAKVSTLSWFVVILLLLDAVTDLIAPRRVEQQPDGPPDAPSGLAYDGSARVVADHE
jgi:hypothetical protein